jgi:hypothetical protein
MPGLIQIDHAQNAESLRFHVSSQSRFEGSINASMYCTSFTVCVDRKADKIYAGVELN